MFSGVMEWEHCFEMDKCKPKTFIKDCINFQQKHPSRGVLRKKCSVNMQQIYRRTPMPKYDFNKVALHATFCCIFSEHLFLRTHPDGCFCSSLVTSPFLHDGPHASCYLSHFNEYQNIYNEYFFKKCTFNHIFCLLCNNRPNFVKSDQHILMPDNN